MIEDRFEQEQARQVADAKDVSVYLLSPWAALQQVQEKCWKWVEQINYLPRPSASLIVFAGRILARDQRFAAFGRLPLRSSTLLIGRAALHGVIASLRRPSVA